VRSSTSGERALAVLAAATLIAVAACGDRPLREGGGAGAPAAFAPPAPELRYAPGLWRLSSFEQLDRVVLWLSVIWIRHAQATVSDAPIGPPGWQPWGPPPERSRAQAHDLARDVQRRAQAEPQRFAELARAYSDDVATRDAGGSLGGMRASQLPAHVLDALAALSSGQVSRAIEDRSGFLVVYRREAPPLAQVAGRRIVVAHRGAPWLEARAGAATRTRAQAQARAQQVAALARSGRAFEELVAAHSDHADALRQGDIGLYSTRDPGGMPRQVETLSQLEPGEVAEPIETPAGFEILERTGAEARPSYAAAVLEFPFDPRADASEPTSEPRVERVALRIAAELRDQPALFAGFARQYCCAEVKRWSAGREPPGILPALERLQPGELSPRPIRAGAAFYLLRRVDLARAPAPSPPVYELPRDPHPDLDQLVRRARGAAVARYIRFFAERGGVRLRLERARQREFVAVHQQLAQALERENDEGARSRLLHDALAELQALLGERAFDAYLGLVRGHMARELLGGGRRG
jgi:hypothetical protein